MGCFEALKILFSWSVNEDSEASSCKIISYPQTKEKGARTRSLSGRVPDTMEGEEGGDKDATSLRFG